MTDFFIYSIKSPQISKAIFFFDNMPRVLMYQKRQISLLVGYKTRRLGMIVTSLQDFKLHEKQISPTFFLETTRYCVIS